MLLKAISFSTQSGTHFVCAVVSPSTTFGEDQAQTEVSVARFKRVLYRRSMTDRRDASKQEALTVMYQIMHVMFHPDRKAIERIDPPCAKNRLRRR
jgi:hypothetical protein